MTELVGYMLMFLSLAAMLSLSLVGFQEASETASERLAELRAESIAQRSATVAVDISILANEFGAQNLTFDRTLEAPPNLEGRNYHIALVGNLTGANETPYVQVTIPSMDYNYTTNIFSAASPVGYDICVSGAFGGTIKIGFIQYPAPPQAASGYCIKMVSEHESYYSAPVPTP